MYSNTVLRGITPYGVIISILTLLCLFTAGCSDSVDKTSVSGSSTRARVTIDAGRCIGCVARPCYESCPQRAIEEREIGPDYIYIIDPSLCTDCGICINKCPYNAITWKR